MLIFLALSGTAVAQQKDDATLISRPADVGLIYPLSTNGTAAAQYSNRFSLQALAGVSGAVQGSAFAGIANIVKGNADGAVFAGIANLIGGRARGGQFAGILNAVKEDVTGFQAAGLVNTAGSLNGVQAAGLANIIRGKSRAVQVGGLFNKADEARAQLAGLVNKAGKVKGVQIAGLLNIADSSDYPIGFVNIIKTGDKSIGISTDETLNGLLSFRSGGRVLYGILGAGYNLKTDYDLYAVQAGIGAHLLNSGRFRLNAEGTQLFQMDLKGNNSLRYTLHVLPEINLTGRLALYAGPTVNLLIDYSDDKFTGQTDHYFWSTRRRDHFLGAWIGVAGGLKFML
ncbi:hypothetical protein GCM10023143_29390 [Compostibacter hankyongensis]|uniref:DUF3034 family protein n=2 Tax=Compostibacter hankyongensis TaxID=1007089 RepID=A0ABP8G4Q8_9BACT